MINSYLVQEFFNYKVLLKFIVIMKLTCILIFLTCLNVSASVFSQQKISLDVKKTKLGNVLKIIEEQSGYHFVYSSANVPVNRDITLTVKNTLVTDILSSIFSNTNLKYSVSDAGLIVISRIQDIKVTGTVKDNHGVSLPGASVRIKGTGAGTSTDINGKFSILAPPNATLVVSYAGFQSQEVAVGNRLVFDITLQEDTKLLTEVVVTALGIKKERRALGYSVSQVQGESLTQARENNVANSLVGKVAGLDITSTAGGVGAATNITIRGVSSLGQSNQPLFVINGVPMENQPVGVNNVNPNGNSGSVWDNAPDLGDAIGNLNPDDIESVSVLKGAAASALYGSRAKSGVILITTKGGKGNSIDFNSNYVIEQVMDRTDWQDVYGQGSNGMKPATAVSAASVGSSSWGGKLDGSNVIQFDGVSRPYVAQKNNVKNFYRDGSTWTNTIALNKTFDGGSIRFSANNLTNKSIVPNSGLNRQSFNFVGTFDPIKRLTVDVRTNYILEQAKNRPMLSDGAGNANFNLTFLPTSINVNDLKPYKTANGNEIGYNTGNPYATNPWFAAYEFINNTNRDRLISSFSAKYVLENGLFIQGRAGRDAYTDTYKSVVPSGTAYNLIGKMADQKTRFADVNADMLIGKSFEVRDDFTITPNVGASFRNTKIDQTTNNGTGFSVPGVYNILNTASKTVALSESEVETQSVYGTLELAYRDILYLTGSVRTDWFSTLATPGKDNKLYVTYPSVSGSFVFSELLKPGILTFGKLRAGYAVVGQATSAYQTQLTYSFRGETLNGKPMGTISNNNVPNSGLVASLASELEMGTELRFFNNRLNLDLTYYNKRSKDEIASITTSSTTGYVGAVVNTGEIQNQGFEGLISGTILKTKNFSWVSSLNGSYNDNTVIKLAPGTTEQTLATSRTQNGFLRNIPGMAAAQVMAYDYKYDANGNIMRNAAGVPDKGATVAFGSAFHKWFGGWNNEFTYKGITMSFLIDGKWGGKLFSATDYYGYLFGLHKGTLVDREALGTNASEFHRLSIANVSKPFVLDASFIKLRQFTLGYNFPAKMFNNKIKSLNVNFVGRNLFILMKKTDNIDPESSYNATFPGLELGGVPPARTFGLNLSVKF